MAPGASGNEFYFCYVSALQYLFIRNYKTQTTVKRIALMYFPTSLSISDYSKVCQEMELSKPKNAGLSALVAVGTCEGRALVYRIDSVESSKAVCRTQAGTIYGQVTGLNLSDNG